MTTFLNAYRLLPEDPKDLKIKKLEKQLNRRKSILRFVLRFIRIFFRTRMMRAAPQIVTKEVPVTKWYSIETQYKVKAWRMDNGTFAGYYTCPRFGKLQTCYSHNGIKWYYGDPIARLVCCMVKKKLSSLFNNKLQILVQLQNIKFQFL